MSNNIDIYLFCRLLFHAGKWDNTGSSEHGSCDGTPDKNYLDLVSLSSTSDSKAKKKYEMTFLSFYTKTNTKTFEWILIKVVSLNYIWLTYIMPPFIINAQISLGRMIKKSSFKQKKELSKLSIDSKGLTLNTIVIIYNLLLQNDNLRGGGDLLSSNYLKTEIQLTLLAVSFCLEVCLVSLKN